MRHTQIKLIIMGSVEEGGSVREACDFFFFFFLIFFIVKDNIPTDNDSIFGRVKHKQNL